MKANVRMISFSDPYIFLYWEFLYCKLTGKLIIYFDYSADNFIAIATLALIGRFCVNIAFNIGLQYAAEIMPTVIRAQGVSAVHIAGYVAALVAPQIVLLVIRTSLLLLLHFIVLILLVNCTI